MSAWSEMERVALLGTRRERLHLPPIAPELDKLLNAVQGEEAAHALLISAGTLDLYEQIGRTSAQLSPGQPSAPPSESKAACSPQAAGYLAQLLEGPLRGLLPEFLGELEKRGGRLPETLLPNLLAQGQRRPALRPAILPVLGSSGRWLAAHHEKWGYAALDPANWPSIRSAWEKAPAAQRPSLVAQLRAEDAEQGRALVESVWRGLAETQRQLLIKQLEVGLSMEDEPLLETALDDRSLAVRRKAAELLAYLPESRLCRRMIEFVPRYLAWTPAQTRKITVSLPPVSPEMRRSGIVGANSKVVARVRGQEIIQLISGVPLAHWPQAWDVDPRLLLQAIPSTAWPRTLTSGFALAALRQNDAAWARRILDEAGITAVTARLIPVLDSEDLRSLLLRALVEQPGPELNKDTRFLIILRRWTGSWDAALTARLLEAFLAHFRLTASAKGTSNLVRELFLKLARQADPDFSDTAAVELSDLERLGVWRSTAAEFLHILRFRRDMLAALGEAA